MRGGRNKAASSRHAPKGLEAIAKLRETAGLTRNDPGFTVMEYQKEFELASYSSAENQIGGMLAKGWLIKGSARRRDSGGQLRRVNVYRPAKR
ncbi:MAG: hypothetical protein ACREDU_02925 [Methylocella sp.]